MFNQMLFSREFIALAEDEVAKSGDEVVEENVLKIIKSWCEIYDDVPPRNAAESAVADALERAAAILIETIKAIPMPV